MPINRRKPFSLEVSRGFIEAHNRASIGGHLSGLNVMDGTVLLWEFKKPYTYLTEATQLYISSTDAGDNAVILVTGLDGDYNEVTRLVTLNGQNQVALNGLMLRVFVHIVISAGNANGDLYIAEQDTLTNGKPNDDTKVKSYSPAASKGSANGLLTVPVGKIFAGFSIAVLSGKAKNVTVSYSVRLFGTQFTGPAVFEVYEAPFIYEFDPPFLLPEKSDIQFLVSTNDNETPVTVLFSAMFIKV